MWRPCAAPHGALSIARRPIRKFLQQLKDDPERALVEAGLHERAIADFMSEQGLEPEVRGYRGDHEGGCNDLTCWITWCPRHASCRSATRRTTRTRRRSLMHVAGPSAFRNIIEAAVGEGNWRVIPPDASNQSWIRVFDPSSPDCPSKVGSCTSRRPPPPRRTSSMPFCQRCLEKV